MVSTGEYQVLSGGATEINFWKLEGSSLSKKQGRFGKKKQVPLLCAANLKIKDDWKVVLGTASGDLYVYDEREVTNSVEKVSESTTSENMQLYSLTLLSTCARTLMFLYFIFVTVH